MDFIVFFMLFYILINKKLPPVAVCSSSLKVYRPYKIKTPQKSKNKTSFILK